jgi:diguanylate cyclase (GGDEF)-like protein/PAS domain S-box-containing protein
MYLDCDISFHRSQMNFLDPQLRESCATTPDAAEQGPSRSAMHEIDNRDKAVNADESLADTAMAQRTLESIGDAVICTDTEGKVTFLNPVAETLCGWSREKAVGVSVHEIMHVIGLGDDKDIRTPILHAIANNTAANTTNGTLVRRDGVKFAIENSIAPIHDRGGEVIGAVTVFRDVSASRALEQRMAHLAQHDMLTGLANRWLLHDRLELAIGLALRHNQQLALLFVDMDLFKNANDSFGHPIGDQCLMLIAERLRSCVRSTDTVCRFGGDEFVVLLSEIKHSADAILCASKISGELSLPYHLGELELHFTASIGVAIYPNDGRDPEALLMSADRAMLDAKRHGGDRIQLCRPVEARRAPNGSPNAANSPRRRRGH